MTLQFGTPTDDTSGITCTGEGVDGIPRHVIVIAACASFINTVQMVTENSQHPAKDQLESVLVCMEISKSSTLRASEQ